MKFLVASSVQSESPSSFVPSPWDLTARFPSLTTRPRFLSLRSLSSSHLRDRGGDLGGSGWQGRPGVLWYRNSAYSAVSLIPVSQIPDSTGVSLNLSPSVLYDAACVQTTGEQLDLIPMNTPCSASTVSTVWIDPNCVDH